MQITKLLLNKHLINTKQIKIAFEEQLRTGEPISDIITNLGFISETDLTELLSKEFEIPIAEIDGMSFDQKIHDLIPEKTVIEKKVIPINIEGTYLEVATSDPTNLLIFDDLAFVTGYNIKPVIAKGSSINKIIEDFYGNPEQTESGVFGPEESEVDQNGEQVQTESHDSISINSMPELETDDASPQSDIETENTQEVETEFEELESIDIEYSDDFDISDELIKEDPELFDAEKNQDIENEITDQNINYSEDSFKSPFSSAINLVEQDTEPQAEVEEEVTEGNEVSSDQSVFAPPVYPEVGETYDEDNNGIDIQTEETGEFTLSPPEHQESDQTVFTSSISHEVQDNQTEENPEDQIYIEMEETDNETESQFSVFTSSVTSDEEKTLFDEESEDDLKIEDDTNILGFSSSIDEAVTKDNPLTMEKETEDKESVDYKELGFVSSIDSEDSAQLENLDEKIFEMPVNDEDEQMEDDNVLQLGFSSAIRSQDEVPNIEEYMPDKKLIDPADTDHASTGIILVIDDSLTVHKTLANILEEEGYTLISAADGLEAFGKLNETVPDLIFLDSSLPDTDGYQLCKLIKSNQQTKEIPIVIFTKARGFLDSSKINSAGADDQLAKPFDSDSILNIINKYSK